VEKEALEKTTVAVNLAFALSKKYKVGIFDADLHSPSVNILVENLPVERFCEMEGFKINPAIYSGVKINSTGFFPIHNKTLIWNSEYEFGALYQMLFSIDWKLDYLIIDLPPSISDIHKEIARAFPNSQMVLVTTPSKLSYADTSKGYFYFKKMGINSNVLIQNMSIGDKHSETHARFQKDFFENKINNFFIPYSLETIDCDECGIPVVIKHKKFMKLFCDIATSAVGD
jgi:ATP-binding protein involved in chromosome partitioning